jgi:F-type H+-transporting ATPase subunit b
MLDHKSETGTGEQTAVDHAAMAHEGGEAAGSETHAATEQEHAVPTAFGIDPSGWVALAMVAVFLIMLKMKVPAMVAGMLDQKIAGIKENLDAAEKLRADAEALKAEYEGKLMAAAKDSDAMKAAAEDEAKLIITKAKDDATALIGRRAKAAEDKIAAAERGAIADVRAKAASAAAAAAAQLIAAHHDTKVDNALIDETIAKLN